LYKLLVAGIRCTKRLGDNSLIAVLRAIRFSASAAPTCASFFGGLQGLATGIHLKASYIISCLFAGAGSSSLVVGCAGTEEIRRYCQQHALSPLQTVWLRCIMRKQHSCGQTCPTRLEVCRTIFSTIFSIVYSHPPDEFMLHEAAVTCVAVSEDGALLATGASDSKLKVRMAMVIAY
jgi:hypothetical protein